MREFLVAGLAMTMLASAPALAKAQDQAETADAEASQVETATEEAAGSTEAVVAENDPNEVICHRRRQTGSNFRERICMTRRQIEQSEAAAEHSLERMRRGSPYEPN